MQDSTKRILDEIKEQWCRDKLYVTVGFNKDNQEVYTVANMPKSNTSFRRRAEDKIQKGQDIPVSDIVCTILVSPDHHNRDDSEAFIYFRGSYSIDHDYKGIYQYIKRFLAIIKTKVRQTNSLAIQVKLGMMTRQEFDSLLESFAKNKEGLVYEKPVNEESEQYN